MPTVADLQATLIGRCGAMMAAVGLDGATKDGTNADLAVPIARGLLECGIACANMLRPADSDLATLAAWNVLKTLDIATLEVLYNAQTLAAAMVDEYTGEDSQRLSQFGLALAREIALYEAKVRKPYGPALAGSRVSRIEAGECMPFNPRLPGVGRDHRGWVDY